jgi:gliding motility-associated-like protein
VSGPNTAANYTWTSPPPTTTSSAPGAEFNIPGTYTLAMQLLSNGCISTTTFVVNQSLTPPATVAVNPIFIPCGASSGTVNILAGVTTNSTSYTYFWKGPVGAGIHSANSYSPDVNMVGTYYCTITNTVNGCVAENSVSVFPSTLTASFNPDPPQGYSPLTVNFQNTTVLTGTPPAGTVTTTWNYGNGSSITTTNNATNGTPNGNTVYGSAGSYTVLLIVIQSAGTASCVGTATAVVNVDLPSDLIIPNVFTPNGDGSNDFFTVQSTNLSTITCQIFDRWGQKMYDVNSTTGNISWDGKNLFGKDVVPGTYYYVLKATGKDGTVYDKKGTVNVYR